MATGRSAGRQDEGESAFRGKRASLVVVEAGGRVLSPGNGTLSWQARRGRERVPRETHLSCSCRSWWGVSCPQATGRSAGRQDEGESAFRGKRASLVVVEAGGRVLSPGNGMLSWQARRGRERVPRETRLSCSCRSWWACPVPRQRDAQLAGKTRERARSSGNGPLL
ncbi:hypothetical protein NDU88_003259 [Pleurodeles waltl]|uniref:Uncharacterized protein n=1 Tax=Pleurodeles waltl TaxID=8319 RepID=A0AAV7T511_PLEWA|nr:hypothetical protein NDU88_003259 [Pleurodeles waltl]